MNLADSWLILLLEVSESANGLAVGSGGNMSVRVPGGILITSTGSKLDDLKPDEIIFVSAADGDEVYYIGAKKPSSEAVCHWTIYQERSDVQAVSHVNVGPKDGKAITVTKEELPYGTIELANDTSAMFKQTDVVMLKNHGVIVAGKTLLGATQVLVEYTDRNKPYIFAPGQVQAIQS